MYNAYKDFKKCIINLPSLISNPKIQLRVVTNASAFSGLRDDLHLVMILPPILKQDSEATVVMGIPNISLAIMLNEGNRFEFSFHQVKYLNPLCDLIGTHPNTCPILKFCN